MFHLIWLLVGVCICSWTGLSRAAKRTPLYTYNEKCDMTLSKTFPDCILIYTFNQRKIATIDEYFKKIEYASIRYTYLARNRLNIEKVSPLEHLKRKYFDIFSALPQEVLMMNAVYNPMEPESPPIMELSTVGGFDYAIYEVEARKVQLVNTALDNVVVFKDQPCYADFNEERPVLEIRFPLRKRSYFVLGCMRFWSIMSPELITPLLEAEGSFSQKVESIVQAACIRYLSTRENNTFSESMASEACLQKRVPSLRKTIYCVLFEITKDDASSLSSDIKNAVQGVSHTRRSRSSSSSHEKQNKIPRKKR